VKITAKSLLCGAVACGLAFGIVLALAYWSGEARAVDSAALQGFLGLDRAGSRPLINSLIDIGNPAPVALIGISLALLALARGRPRVALFVLVLIAITSVSSQTLKALLAHPRPREVPAGIGDAAFPSGHATAIMSLAIALVVAMPARLRPPAAALGLGLVVAVSYSLVSLGGHFPSDVLGGYLLATGTALVLLAGLRAAEVRYPEREGRRKAVLVAHHWADRVAAVGLAAGLSIGMLVAGGLVILAAFRGPQIVDYAQANTTFFVVAGVLALSALLLLAALTSVLSRRA